MLMLIQPTKRQKSAGDTIIEVLVAVTVFSMIAVGGIAVMNQGAATAQRSLEITLVRQEIDAQAEALRFLNAAYISEYNPVAPENSDNYSDPALTWINLKNNLSASASSFGVGAGNKCSVIPDTSFVINTRNLQEQLIKSASSLDHSVTYAKVNYDDVSNNQKITSIDGLWVEAVKGVDNSNLLYPNYVDFHIRACWDSLGQATPVTLGTIVRLYEPK